jgi:hypothetical protein
MNPRDIRGILASARFEDLTEAFRPKHDFDGSLWAQHCFDGETRFPCPTCQVKGGYVRRNTGARNPFYAVVFDNLTYRCDSCQHFGTRFEVEDAVLHSRDLLEMFLQCFEVAS